MMISQIETKLLQSGVQTNDILTAYLSTIKTIKYLDPSMLSIISQPFQTYLLHRSDTIKCIVASLASVEDEDLDFDDNVEDQENVEIETEREELELPVNNESESNEESNDKLIHSPADQLDDGSSHSREDISDNCNLLGRNMTNFGLEDPSGIRRPPLLRLKENALVGKEEEDEGLDDQNESLLRPLPKYAVPKHFDLVQIGEMDFIERFNRISSQNADKNIDPDEIPKCIMGASEALLHVYGHLTEFAREYIDQLARRVITVFYRSGKNFEILKEFANRETRYLSSLKERFGEAHMDNCQVIIKDASETSILNKIIHGDNEFLQEMIQNGNTGIFSKGAQLNILIFSKEFWPHNIPMMQESSTLGDRNRPESQLKDLILPKEIMNALELYGRTYAKHKEHRILEYKKHFGKVSLDITMRRRDGRFKTTRYNVTPLLACIVCLFHEEDKCEEESKYYSGSVMGSGMDVDVEQKPSTSYSYNNEQENNENHMIKRKNVLTGQKIASSLGVPHSLVKRKINFWINQGLIIETEKDCYLSADDEHFSEKSTDFRDASHSALLSTCSSRNIINMNSSDENYNSIEGEDKAGNQDEEIPSDTINNTRNQIIWLYIKNILTNMESLTLERMFSILKIFMKQLPVLAKSQKAGSEFLISDLQKFLEIKVKDGLLEYVAEGTLYRLTK
ncbi:unnamed protein product [Gordionus sp. m RMFG-2023]|uniref:anaphase-promoting complex subunit 2-like n=1 Tax=Gordionus sp. m RMFG-2023 TaxID=3053472 RepID=UPI0030E126C8